MRKTLRATAQDKPLIELTVDDAFTEQPVQNTIHRNGSGDEDILYVKVLDATRNGDLAPAQLLLQNAGYHVEITEE